MSPKILIIEDEEKIARFVELELSYEGYTVAKAYDGRTGLELAETGDFDLVLLDVMLPKLSGTEVLRRIRRTSAVPIIMLTARDSVMDKVSGLDSGANDYITKPFAIEELLARIRNTLRTTTTLSSTEVLSASGLNLDTDRHTVTMMGKAIDLTKREFDLLHFLLKNKGIVVTREALLEHVWGYDFTGDTNSVDVYIRFLRGKIDEVFDIKLIHTVRGVGYVIKDER
ncbi:response regulator with CheY-like receiver domain and winged-helix DNA-binding domain [Desulfitobacterium dichloroeliminans LMG P-21439]|uniref:Stage 0 sporulation protein A homolog n=1 Tax=Desulfitobacterium dichloroeliminans (strain LMG P-21439 / DCA1) TaxID=871963 RepID=L0F589_DESDL|nr:response regulator transcription factor [Desulfitobacterium dichloroeliminans]AGA68093.1 response regulator with CheY-like receiver domain and winged-helix DNA-binding domain [Desulfitobacterium dichloroeliminans LMG P-21439]